MGVLLLGGLPLTLQNKQTQEAHGENKETQSTHRVEGVNGKAGGQAGAG